MERSPSLEEYKDGMPEKLPDSSGRRKRAWIAIAVLAGVAVIFGVLNLARSDSFARLAGVGGVKGMVADEQGQPLPAEIFVLKTNLTAEADASGYFEIQGVPAGQQTLVVGYLAKGIEVPVRIAGGETRDLGQIQLPIADQMDRIQSAAGSEGGGK